MIFEPRAVVAAELLESTSLAGPQGRVPAGEGESQAGFAEGYDGCEIDALFVQAAGRPDVIGLEQASISQFFEADQQWVASQGRGRLVWRVAPADRPDREHLPPALAGGSEKINEAERGRAKIAAAVWPGERRQVQQNA